VLLIQKPNQLHRADIAKMLVHRAAPRPRLRDGEQRPCRRERADAHQEERRRKPKRRGSGRSPQRSQSMVAITDRA
jgi:hypothetical protein